MKCKCVGIGIGSRRQGSNSNMSAELQTIENLQAEIARLQDKLKRKTRSAPIEFLGETLDPDLLPELASGRKLSPTAVKTRGLGYHGDGGNLWLQVTPGGRSWIFRYRWQERQREMGLGSLAEVGLAEARGRAAICRRLVRSGVDPIERKREGAAVVAAATAKRITFKEAAQRYIEAHKAGWKNPKHAAQWPSTLEAYVYPHFGAVSVRDIDTGVVLKAIEPIWTEKPETATRVRGRIESILDWARVRGYRDGENPARWKGHLDHLLPARSKVQKVKSHDAIAWGQMHAFWTELTTRDSMSSEALRLAILTAARTGEIIGATWDEIDLAARTWTIPAERMKAGREHRVPLSAEAVSVLERMAKLKVDDNPHVFRGAKKGAGLSNMAMTELIKGMEWEAKITVHGFRSAFRDWAAEATAYPGDMVEMAMAHAISNKVEAAYRRGDMFERRRRLMEDWARHCLTAPAPAAGNVREIGVGR